ncbi:MAG: TerB family tellurite resistance protein [Saprospiraceae bacterium]
MVGKVELYDAFGELMYAVAKADGLIQNEEIQALNKLVESHPWAKEIVWSFNYEQGKGKSVEEAYEKALYTCQQYGPSPEYPELLSLLTEIAAASEGVSNEEKAIIQNFEKELRAKFEKELQQGKLIIRK